MQCIYVHLSHITYILAFNGMEEQWIEPPTACQVEDESYLLNRHIILPNTQVLNTGRQYNVSLIK